MEQQHHIWELVTTEHNHITIISTAINSLLTCLKELHNGLSTFSFVSLSLSF